MEIPWQNAGIYLGLTLFDSCVAYPADFSTLGDGPSWWGALLAAAVFSVCSVLLLGCLCCRNDKGFQEFTDSTSSHSVSTAGGFASSSAELTVFPPPVAAALAIPGDRSSVVHFEPLPDIRPPLPPASRRPAAFTSAVSHGLSAHDWFQTSHTNFPRHQMKYVRELGRGWFGRVVEGEAQGVVPGQTTTVIVKILHEDATAADQMYFLQEVKPYRDLRHPNILRLVGCCLETDPFLVLLESCPGGDLKSFLTTNIATADALNQQGVILLMACNIADGLHHMLDKGFVHTDLAARNCLVAPDLTVKIGDYGTSIETYKEEYYCAGDVALPIRWCAPETLHCTDTTIETKELTASANVWSLGVVLWELCQFGKLPYAELSDEEVIVKVLVEDDYRLSLPTLPSPHRHNLYQVMKQCWSCGPQRPALGQVLRMLNHLYASREHHGQDGGNSSLGTDQQFERRWQLFKPNTIPKTDNQVTNQLSISAVQSPVKDAEMLTGHQEPMLCKFRSADALLPDFIDQVSVRNSSRRDSENLGSTTPLTTSPQPSLSSSTGGEFFLPSIHNYHKSPSLQNLRGSIDDLSEGLSDAQKLEETGSLSEEIEGQQKVEVKSESAEIEAASDQEFDSWLKGVSTTNEEDAKFVRKISEAIRDLDDALALEKTSSSSSDTSSKCASNHSTPAKQTSITDQNVVLDFRLGKTIYQPCIERFVEETFQPDSFQEDSLSDLHRRASRGTDSGTDTEDETWRKRVEQGEFTKKVKEKSKSVADLMVLTHIECSDGSDSDTPSLTRSFERGLHCRNSLKRQRSSPTRMLAASCGALYGSDSNIHTAVLGKEFEDTLEKLRAVLKEQEPSAKPKQISIRSDDIVLSDQFVSCSEETLLNFPPPEDSPMVKVALGENCCTVASDNKGNNFLSLNASDILSRRESQTSVEWDALSHPSKDSVLVLRTLSKVPDISNIVPSSNCSLDSDIGVFDRLQMDKTYNVQKNKPECKVIPHVASIAKEKDDDVDKCDDLAVHEFKKSEFDVADTSVNLPKNVNILNFKEEELADKSKIFGFSHIVTSTPLPVKNRTNVIACNTKSVVIPFPTEGLPNIEMSILDCGNCASIKDLSATGCRSVADSETNSTSVVEPSITTCRSVADSGTNSTSIVESSATTCRTMADSESNSTSVLDPSATACRSVADSETNSTSVVEPSITTCKSVADSETNSKSIVVSSATTYRTMADSESNSTSVIQPSATTCRSVADSKTNSTSVVEPSITTCRSVADSETNSKSVVVSSATTCRTMADSESNSTSVLDPSTTECRSVAELESLCDATSKCSEVVGENTHNFVVGESEAVLDNHKKASVIIGPCEDYMLDYFKGLKTTFVDKNRKLSSPDFVANNSLQNYSDGTDFITDIDYSLDPWDKYMENDQECKNEGSAGDTLLEENNLYICTADDLQCDDIYDVSKVSCCREEKQPLSDACHTVAVLSDEHQDIDSVSKLTSGWQNNHQIQKTQSFVQNEIADACKLVSHVLIAEQEISSEYDDACKSLKTAVKSDTCGGVKNNNFELHIGDERSLDLSTMRCCSTVPGKVGPPKLEGLAPQEERGQGTSLALPSVNLITATPVSSGRNSPEVHCNGEVWQTEIGGIITCAETQHLAEDNAYVDTPSENFILLENPITDNSVSNTSVVCYSQSSMQEDGTGICSEIDYISHMDDDTTGETDIKSTTTSELQMAHSLKEQAFSSCPLSPRMGEKGRLETCDSSGTEDSAFDFPRSDDVSTASNHCKDATFDRSESWEGKVGGEQPNGFVPMILNVGMMPGVKINVENFQGEYQINRCEVGAQLDEDSDEFGLDIAKHSTPDDERSSDSGFRDKGSLSESCEDACDEKYHLEDIEAELEDTFNRGGFTYVGRGGDGGGCDEEEDEQCCHEECAASQSSREGVVCDTYVSHLKSSVPVVALEPDNTSPQIDSNEDSLEGTILATPNHSDDFDSSLILSFIETEQKHTELSSPCLQDKCYCPDGIHKNEAFLNETYMVPNAGSGWYLHPPAEDSWSDMQTDGGDGDELPGHSSLKSCSSAGSRDDDGNNSDNSYVSFGLDEEFAAAIRSELQEKLSCGLQRSESEESEIENVEDEEDEDRELVVDSDDLPPEERTDITIHYGTYPASLSPILEEGESLSSLTTTLSDQFSPFMSNALVAAGGEHEGPVFVLDLNKEDCNLGLKKFEDDIREALANCSLSSEDTESSGAKEACSGVLVEDLDPQANSLSTVLVHDTKKHLEEDDLLLIDVETNKAVLLESPTPKSHLAFIQSKKIIVAPSLSPTIDSSCEIVGSNSDNSDVCDHKFELTVTQFDAGQSCRDKDVFTPDSISPEGRCVSPEFLTDLETPKTENMLDYFLTRDASAVRGDNILVPSPRVDSPCLPDEMADMVEDIYFGECNSEATKIISELESRGFISSKEEVADNAMPKIHDLPSSSDSEHVEMLSLEDNSCSLDGANQKLSELASSMLGFASHKQATETSDSNDSSYLSPAKRQQDCCSAESSISELSSTEEPNVSVVRNHEEAFLQDARDWSKPSPEAVLLSTKAPMPSPEEEAWKKLPSVLALSDLSNVMARCGTGEADLSQPYDGRDDDNMMTTSFSNRDEDPDCYTPDWESESEDTNEDDNSSSSGEFIWKDGEREERVPAVKVTTTPTASKVYEGLGEFPMEAIVEEEEDDDGDDDIDESSSSGSGTEFVPSAWNSIAIPVRSALRSPDKKLEHKKRVSFKRQKYHCVYEYPRDVSDSETEGQDRQYWNRFTPQLDYSSYADWELDGDTAELATQDLDNDLEATDCYVPQQFDFYKLSSIDYDIGTGMLSDGDFLASSTSQSLTMSSAPSTFTASGTATQFFPGHTPHHSSEDGDVDSILLDIVSGDEEQDVCDDEIDTSFGREGGSEEVPAGLGELRHTRDRLKLDLGVAGSKRAGLELVQGEASLLDSGIESGNGAQSARTMQAALESAS